jgi:hypothetical protein
MIVFHFSSWTQNVGYTGPTILLPVFEVRNKIPLSYLGTPSRQRPLALHAVALGLLYPGIALQACFDGIPFVVTLANNTA